MFFQPTLIIDKPKDGVRRHTQTVKMKEFLSAKIKSKDALHKEYSCPHDKCEKVRLDLIPTLHFLYG